jgi:hypothetical protein
MVEALDIGLVVALQYLPARRRALLLLRDVEGFTTDETADILDEGDEWVDSELPRARAALDQHRRPRRAPPPPAGSPAERDLVGRFAQACRARDPRTLAQLLAADVVLTVPAAGFEVRGRWAVRDALPTGPHVRLLVTRANGQPAFACYLAEPGGARAHADGLIVLTLEGRHVGELTGFPGAAVLRPFGLPPTVRAAIP